MQNSFQVTLSCLSLIRTDTSSSKRQASVWKWPTFLCSGFENWSKLGDLRFGWFQFLSSLISFIYVFKVFEYIELWYAKTFFDDSHVSVIEIKTLHLYKRAISLCSLVSGITLFIIPKYISSLCSSTNMYRYQNLKTTLSYYFLPIVMNANYILYNELFASITFVKYWNLIWCRSPKSRYVDLVKRKAASTSC